MIYLCCHICFPLAVCVMCPWNRQDAETPTELCRTSVLWNRSLASSCPWICLYPFVYSFPVLLTFLYPSSSLSSWHLSNRTSLLDRSFAILPSLPTVSSICHCQYAASDFPEVITNFGKTTIHFRDCVSVCVRAVSIFFQSLLSTSNVKMLQQSGEGFQGHLSPAAPAPLSLSIVVLYQVMKESLHTPSI